MNILDFFNFFNKENQFTGVILSPFDFYQQSELVAGYAPVTYKEKKRAEWRTFFPQYQASQSSCVAHTTAKIATILYFNKTGYKVRFSSGFFYTLRSNKPGLGMAFNDIQVLSSKGCLPYELLPSDGISEAQVNSLKVEPFHFECAKPFALPDKWIQTKNDFDIVASTIQKTNKGLMLWFEFGKGEWMGVEKPVIRTKPQYRHAVVALDAFKYNGEDVILIEDSADNVKWQKLITRDYFSRCILSAYPMNFVFEIGGTKPKYDGTIVSMQYCLEYEGFFPKNVAKAENVGQVTKDSLIKFQSKYGIIVTGTVTPSTENKLKELYG